MTTFSMPNLEQIDLAPHPLAPKVVGELVGKEVLRVSWLAKHLGVEFDVLADWDNEICPEWPKRPMVPKHVWPFPLEDQDLEWIRAYHLGLSLTLAQAEGWQRHAPIVKEALEKSMKALADSMG